MTKDLPIIVITGPTASGKTGAAINLAEKINAEIISADSRAVYRGFDIVSAKPTREEMRGICHHLIDIVDPDLNFSAGDFAENAKMAIEDIKARGKRVIISGGTWFYIKALLDDKMLPPISPNQKLRDELEKYDSDKLFEKLNALDPKRASEINKNNKDKIIRSIEMCEAIKGAISSYKREDNTLYDSVWYAPLIDRETLYKNIDKRVDLMVENGLFEEYQKMIEKWGKDNKIVRNTIGYQEFVEYEDKMCAVDKIKQHTRNFAKRQMTYFRSNSKIKTLPLPELLALEDI